ncbi:PilW family protein [Pseudomonas lijiangensis]|uniref:Prepilin-type N-terminal cleavage/methylation domain-containing protein n=1 Tax=Pseudomonas lijiangensis TaxID=2995658 RepID=A0ABX8HPV0_9PSED|nr:MULTISPECIES: prepilin-type N-terminal cleavage/methylation domain-containing protein [Pseudomonas syringae group]MBX8489571.1 prepilin-type N-terminal cleavage/methylation domain-containing protein [Pseudomonas cichorii]MBX8500250.1 prepilin-type N-terminal cleavage/methylation domain-containing protein [Pseudomonas lijiangensis]MBX8505501.1 prepilin-type N-terminal cleavage/methylation domain-containing protein [Pseudomonas lijiangensis]MBX8549020.1 prepilin-type N-terminal cleavage/methyl
MKKSSRGFGLIEIMVALVLGLVVSMGIIQIFSASRGTFLTQNASARMQEDARFVLSKLMQEIRMTGMYGCLGFNNYVPVPPAIAWPAALDNPILWDNANKTLTLVTSDIGTTGTSPTWTIISNCQTSTQLYAGPKLPAAGETAFPMRQFVYTLTGQNLTIKYGTGGTAQPLLQNVSAFDVSFGMAGSPMTYVTTVSTAAAADIRSVRISLTLQDPDNRVRPQQYNVVAYLRNRF